MIHLQVSIRWEVEDNSVPTKSKLCEKSEYVCWASYTLNLMTFLKMYSFE